MRLLVYELRSPILDSSGLIGAIQSRLDAVERRLGVAVTLEAEELPDLPQNLEENVYRIILEALNNALKHASASHIAVAIHFRAGHFEATIEDNGIGFDLEKAAESGGYGLAGMRERVEGQGGTLQIVSCPGNGTRIRVSVPIPNQISKRWMEEDSDQ
jgi:two-component system sensor histidine kinase UhpB